MASCARHARGSRAHCSDIARVALARRHGEASSSAPRFCPHLRWRLLHLDRLEDLAHLRRRHGARLVEVKLCESARVRERGAGGMRRQVLSTRPCALLKTGFSFTRSSLSVVACGMTEDCTLVGATLRGSASASPFSKLVLASWFQSGATSPGGGPGSILVQRVFLKNEIVS